MLTDGPTAPASAGPATLKALREARRVSQSKLAQRAGFDHSHVSRIESGARTPTRDALRSIATALELGADDTGRLHAAFGFLPADTSVLLVGEPEVARLYTLMTGEAVPVEIKTLVRVQLEAIAEQLEVWTP